MTTTTKVRISVLLPSPIVELLKQTAHEKTTTQSAIIQEVFSEWLKERLESDAKELGKMDFSDIGSEKDWHHVQSEALKGL